MPTRIALTCLCIAASLCAALPASAQSVRDDAGRMLTLPHPAERIISMAPHATELLFAAGAGEHLVGTVRYSDYPQAAQRIPRIGDEQQLDLERIAALRPDLIVVWRNGSPERQLQQLRKLGIPLFYSDLRRLEDIPDSIARLGRLAGTEARAQAAANALRAQLAALEQRYAQRSRLKVFYQVWDQPLYTLNGAQIVSDAIRLCGGENIFAALKATAPTVGIEAVLQADPDVIIASDSGNEAQRGLALWRAYPSMRAVRSDNLMRIDGLLLNRPGPRMIEGAAQLCERLDQAREHLASRPAK
jgi:iron complex transport system substrate-binding protein